MRKFEIVLKVLFLALSFLVFQIVSDSSPDTWLSLAIILPIYTLMSIILGAVLIFNKKSSYNYPHTLRDYLIRRVEGTILIIFSCAQISFFIFNLLNWSPIH